MPRFTSALTLLAVTALTAGQASAEAPSGKYVLEKTHAYITLSYLHLGFSRPQVGFNAFEATLDYNAEAPEKSSIQVVIDASSVDSRVEEFDEHLVGERFFDTANHPQITFTSTAVEMTGATTAKITGDLTIKGQTHPVTLDAVLNRAAVHPMLKVPMLGFDASATLNRSQWGLGYAVPAVGDEVDLEISVEMMPGD